VLGQRDALAVGIQRCEFGVAEFDVGRRDVLFQV
jgi:hypothetical protein